MNSIVYGSALLVLLSAGLMVAFNLAARRERKRKSLRFIPAFQNLRRASGLAVEEGRRLHVSLGNSNLLDRNNAAALVGLAALERMGRLSLISDRPTMASSGDAGLAVLCQDVMKDAYRSQNLFESYQSKYAQLTGVTPFSYAAGTLPLIQKEQVAVNLFCGNFGPEIILLNDAAEQQNAFVMAASTALSAQSVILAAGQEPLVGEELFAVPAYLQTGASQFASLRTQDVLRWLIILLLLAGTAYSILKFLGVL